MKVINYVLFSVRPGSPVSLTRPKIITKTDINSEPTSANYIVKSDQKPATNSRTPKATRKLSLKIRGDNVEIQDIVVPSLNREKVKLHRQASGASSLVRTETIRMKDFDEISVVDNVEPHTATRNSPTIEDKQELRRIDKIDEMTASIFNDVGSCDNNKEKMVEINFY